LGIAHNERDTAAAPEQLNTIFLQFCRSVCCEQRVEAEDTKTRKNTKDQ